MNFGASTRGATFATTNTNSFTGPTVAGANTLAIVCTGINNGSISGVTWGGSAMTEITGAAITSGVFKAQMFYRIAPAGGASTVITSSASNWDADFVCASFFTGVDQSSPIDTSGTNTGASGTNFSKTATTNNANEWVIDNLMQINITPSAIIPVAPQTLMKNGAVGGFGAGFGWCSSYKAVAAASSPAMSANSDASSDFIWGWASIKPATAAPITTATAWLQA